MAILFRIKQKRFLGIANAKSVCEILFLLQNFYKNCFPKNLFIILILIIFIMIPNNLKDLVTFVPNKMSQYTIGFITKKVIQKNS